MLQSDHLAGALVAMLQSMLHDCRACYRAAWTSDNFVELDGYFAEWAVEEEKMHLIQDFLPEGRYGKRKWIDGSDRREWAL